MVERKGIERYYKEAGRLIPEEGFIPEQVEMLCNRQQELETFLTLHGGKAEFPALFDKWGNLVAARLVKRTYGFEWGILESDDPNSDITEWFNPSKAVNTDLERKRNARQGYYVGTVRARATVKVVPHGSVIIVRADGGFSRNVTILDNGLTVSDQEAR